MAVVDWVNLNGEWYIPGDPGYEQAKQSPEGQFYTKKSGEWVSTGSMGDFVNKQNEWIPMPAVEQGYDPNSLDANSVMADLQAGRIDYATALARITRINTLVGASNPMAQATVFLASVGYHPGGKGKGEILGGAGEGMPTGGGMPAGGGMPIGESELMGRRPWYQEQYGLNQPRLSPTKQHQLRQFEPLSDLYGLSQRARAGGFGIGGESSPAFSDFEPQYGADAGAMRGGYAQLLSNLLGAGEEQRGYAGMGYDPQVGEAGQVGVSSEIRDILFNALRSVLGYEGAKSLSRQPLIDQQASQWLGGGQGEEEGSSFINYLANKFNLGRWF